jgi:hypothetical protein
MIKFPIVFMMFCLLGQGALAASEDFPELATSQNSLERWYRIELLIYKQKPVPGTIDEIWPHDISLAYPANWVRLKSQEEYIASPYPHPVLATWLSRIKSSPYTPFVLLGESHKTFNKVAKQVERFEGGVLFHGVWWQPFIQNDAQDGPAILIKAGKQFGNHSALEGSIHFRLTRYLHISTDLWFSEFTKPAPEKTAELMIDSNPWPPLPLSPDQTTTPALMDTTPTLIPEAYAPTRVIQIKQSRRMRSNETHYIDHPQIGMIVRLTPQPEKR